MSEIVKFPPVKIEANNTGCYIEPNPELAPKRWYPLWKLGLEIAGLESIDE